MDDRPRRGDGTFEPEGGRGEGAQPAGDGTLVGSQIRTGGPPVGTDGRPLSDEEQKRLARRSAEERLRSPQHEGA